VDLREPHDEAEIVRELEPGRDVAVVVEVRHDDLVAGFERPADGAREREVQRRHVRAEHDLFRRAAEECASGLPGLVDQRLRAAAGFVGAADVCVGLPQVRRDRVDHLVGNLRATGPVEEHEVARQSGEATPHRRYVESYGTHLRDGIRTSPALFLATVGATLVRNRVPRTRGNEMEAAAVPAADVAERAPSAVVAAQDITRRYGEGDTAVDALRGVSLEVEQGKLTAVMGPSGSGKSTLMHILAALDRPTTGSVWIAGEKPGPAWREELLKKVGLDDRRTHRPAELSGGQQQRVAVARALISRPTVVFADEPTGNLDSTTGAEILELLRSSVEELHQTTVMVTHDPRAAAIADRILFLADGCIVRDMPRSDPSAVIAVVDELAAG
jgi:putative ABC transport system ATP-binding protein